MDRIAHYRIVAALGSGGMGEVYRARDERLGRDVALKLLPLANKDDKQGRARMLREARVAGSLNHPGIVTLHDVGESDGRTYLVMELVDGRAFSTLVKEGIPLAQALELVAGAADAMAVAHAHGVFHRDIKSANLMVSASGQPKVLDFGLAKRRSNVRGPKPKKSTRPAGQDPDLTSDGDILGTPQYMSPEQAFGQEVDARSEVFSLGVVLYELVVGQRPFDRGGIEATLEAVRTSDAPVPSKVAPDRHIPPAIDQLVGRALARAPRDRFPDMVAFAAALRGVAAPPRSRRWWLAGGAVAIAGAALGVVLLTHRGSSPPTITVTSSRRLTVDPGCEEYPRFTADGRIIIYDGLIEGDYELLTLDRTTAARSRLTHEAGWDFGVAISPDGKQLAYVHRGPEGREGRLLSIAGDGDGPPRNLGSISSYPAWSPDGTLLLGEQRRIVRRRDGGPDEVVATLPAGAHPYHILQLRKGGFVVLWFTSSEQDAMVVGEVEPGQGEVRIVERGLVDYEGGLAPDTHGDGYYYTRKAATTGNEMMWRRFGSDAAAIAVPGGLAPAGGLDIARDGSAVVFSSCAEQQTLARLRTGTPPVPITRGEWHDHNPVRIDRARVLISSDRSGTIAAWVVDPVTGEAHVVEGARDILAPSPSPDGALVVFAADHGQGGLAVVAVAGGAPRRLTTDPTDTNPVFDHTGKTIVFERTSTGGLPQLFAVPLAGGDVRAIAPPGSSQPGASPSESIVVYVDGSLRGKASRLATVAIDGSPPRLITGLSNGDWHRPRFSPDGKRVLAVQGFVHLVEAPVDGSTPPATVWQATATGGIISADYAPDGDGFIATTTEYNGELWLAEGVFP